MGQAMSEEAPRPEDKNQVEKEQEEEEEKNSCPICVCTPSAQDVACINGCQHTFCFDCIEQWADKENTCPLCKARFTRIERVNPQPLNEDVPVNNVKTVERKDQGQGTMVTRSTQTIFLRVAADAYHRQHATSSSQHRDNLTEIEDGDSNANVRLPVAEQMTMSLFAQSIVLHLDGNDSSSPENPDQESIPSPVPTVSSNEGSPQSTGTPLLALGTHYLYDNSGTRSFHFELSSEDIALPSESESSSPDDTQGPRTPNRTSSNESSHVVLPLGQSVSVVSATIREALNDTQHL